MTRRKRDLTATILAALTACTFVMFGVAAGAPVAHAETGGVDQKPVMGWSSWSFLRFGVNTANVEAEPHAMVMRGLASVGYVPT